MNIHLQHVRRVDFKRRQHNQHQPADQTDQQTGQRPFPTGRTPVQTQHQRRCKLRGSGERNQTNRSQRFGLINQQVVQPADQHQHHDGGAATVEQHAIEVIAAAICTSFTRALELEQQRHDQIVADHRRQGHGCDNHHTRRRREPADERKQGQARSFSQHRQAQHKLVTIARINAEGFHSGNGNRNHQHGKQQQVDRKQPTRAHQIVRIVILNKRDLKLARQTQNCSRRQQRLNPEALRQRPFGE